MKRLLKSKEKFERQYALNPNESVSVQMMSLNDQINVLATERAARSIFRSKCLYAREGEKCSSYFLSLEKRRYLEKNMKCVITDNGVVSRDQNTILNEQTKFYQELYKSDQTNRKICVTCPFSQMNSLMQ